MDYDYDDDVDEVKAFEADGLEPDESGELDESDDRQSLSELSEDASYVCDSCGEEIVVPLDYTQGQNQEFIEDCPVCCNPNVINVDFDPDGVAQITSRSEQDLN